MVSEGAEKLKALLESKFNSAILEPEIRGGDLSIRIARDQISTLFGVFKVDAHLHFDLLVSVTAVDWMDSAAERFEVVYHLLSLKHLHRLRVKVSVPEEKPEVDTIAALWPGANFMEREVWDMYGIRFHGHPDLRRILMYDEFEGHPLRKDYPVQGKQPRVLLRSPEVSNTATLMERPVLVQINKGKKADLSIQQGAKN